MDLVEEFEKKIREEKIKKAQMRKEKRKEKVLNLEEKVFKRSELLRKCYDRCLLELTWAWVQGMTTTISCAGVVSVSASCGRHCNLA